jgi:hypothetical protein
MDTQLNDAHCRVDDEHGEQLDAVSAHRLMNSIAIIKVDSATIATWGHLLGHDQIRSMGDRMARHAQVVTDALVEIVHGISPAAVIDVEGVRRASGGGAVSTAGSTRLDALAIPQVHGFS